MNLGPNGSRGVVLFAQEPRGNDYVGVHGPKGDVYLSRHSVLARSAPAMGFSSLTTTQAESLNRTSTGCDQGIGAIRNRRRALSVLGDVLEPFQHELIMAAIGMMSVRDETEEHDHRPFQQIGSLDRQVQGRIIQRSLRTLHPIDNASPLRIECSSLSQSHPELSQALQ